MKISFLVTYYNQAKYVSKSLDSIFAIEIPCDYEVLVSDDGSIDNTVEEVKKYIEKYPSKIRLFILDRNDGEKDSIKRVSAARMKLLSEATGDFFLVLDGDDCYCDKNFVRQAIDIFSKDKSLSIVAFNYKEHFENNHEIQHKFKETNKLSKSNYIQKYYTPSGACVHKLVDKRDFDNVFTGKYFDDNDIMMFSLHHGEMYHIQRTVYSYLQHESSSWHSSSEIEQGFLNVLNYDIEKNFIPENENDLFIRYLHPIFTIFLLRNNLLEILGQDNYEKMIQRCENFKTGLAYWLITGCRIKNELFYKRIQKYKFLHLKTYLSAVKMSAIIRRKFDDK